MLKSMVQLKHQIDLSIYPQLWRYLKQKMKGFTLEQALVFTMENVAQFLWEPTDEEYLDVKVAVGQVNIDLGDLFRLRNSPF